MRSLLWRIRTKSEAELLFHVISHLSADDLLAVKLVSRRLYDVVSSQHAWINAFARYFPGPDVLGIAVDSNSTAFTGVEMRSEKRSFTRLSASATWTGEYLLRTKLLRCLNRGRPALPFACPAPGKSNKGYATFTFSSRLRFGISHLHAKFGPVLDKRLPQFIHGLGAAGTVSSSDKRGKFDGWGLVDRASFNIFTELYPGTAQWGGGTGEVVGVPNVMDLSSTHGMIHGEGVPGGFAYYLASGEKHGRYLMKFLDEGSHKDSMPRLSSEEASICAVWIAKTPGVVNVTRGLVGLLVGSSNGVLSAYTLGPSSDRDQRFERGELTARWMISPGVPIIAIAVDEQFSEVRRSNGRVWAVVLNALGEVFTLTSALEQDALPTVSEEGMPFAKETRAWRTGQTAPWRLVRMSQRDERQSLSIIEAVPEYYNKSVWGSADSEDFKVIEAWARKSPAQIKADFDGWDMCRRLEVDFAGEDGKGAGENIMVITCGAGDDQSASIIRYTRCTVFQQNDVHTSAVPATASQPEEVQPQTSIFNNPSWSFDEVKSEHSNKTPKAVASSSTDGSIEWRRSDLAFGRYRSMLITTSAVDNSLYATTTVSEDLALRNQPVNQGAKAKDRRSDISADDYAPLRAPGQRARFIAVGSGSGSIFLWDIRAPPSSNTKVVNTIKTFRVIHTDSPEISSLALSSLYLVHGGSEGLVQAWDPLASTLEPVRTISSRTTLNARRRAVIAAQNNPIVQVQMANTSYAASAICLDPDPNILRGVVAIGSHLRYWSYSSADATDELSKSQKRRMNRALRGLNSSSSDAYIGTRRVSMKGVVGQQMADRNIDLKEQQAEEKEERRRAGRYGLNLLGDDASEEEMLAYAKLLSQEEQDDRIRKAMASQAKLGHDASEAEVEAYLNGLSEEDRTRWRYASWQERFNMPVSSEVSTSGTRSSPNIMPAHDEDAELAEAMRLSLEGTNVVASPASDAQSSKYQSPKRSLFGNETRAASGTQDDDIEEAIRLSMVDASMSSPPSVASALKDRSLDDIDDETALAIRLSLADQQGQVAPSSPSLQGGGVSLHQDEDDLAMALHLSALEHDESEQPGGYNFRHELDQDEFPSLNSGSSPSGPQRSSRRKGKGKDRSMW